MADNMIADQRWSLKVPSTQTEKVFPSFSMIDLIWPCVKNNFASRGKNYPKFLRKTVDQ